MISAVVVKKVALMGVLSVVTVAFFVVAVTLHRDTIVEWWKPLWISLVIATLPGLALGRLLEVGDMGLNRVACYCCGVVAMMSVVTGSFYMLNYFGADSDSLETVDAEVSRRYSEQHYQVRRVSRYATSRGRPYHVYYIGLDIPGKGEKVLQVTLERYNKIKKGASMSIDVESGLFGVPVMKEVRKVKPSTKAKRKVSDGDACRRSHGGGNDSLQ